MIRSLPRIAAGLACTSALLVAGAAMAQTTGEPTRAPKATAPAASAKTTLPMARTKARRGSTVATRRATPQPAHGDHGTAGAGAHGSDTVTASGSAAPGGPGSPPPTLPVPTPGAGASPPASVTGPGMFERVDLLKV